MRITASFAMRLVAWTYAERVIVAKGAGGLTHRAVAAQAGVSLASTTYHFPTIDDLRRETLRYAARVVGEEFAGSLRCSDHDSPVERLADRWREIGKAHQSEFVALFTLFIESLHDEELRPDADELLAEPANMLLQAGVPEDVTDAVVGSLIGLALVSLVRGDSKSQVVRFNKAVTSLVSGRVEKPIDNVVKTQE